jgi:hypothetical protein
MIEFLIALNEDFSSKGGSVSGFDPEVLALYPLGIDTERSGDALHEAAGHLKTCSGELFQQLIQAGFQQVVADAYTVAIQKYQTLNTWKGTQDKHSQIGWGLIRPWAEGQFPLPLMLIVDGCAHNLNPSHEVAFYQSRLG